MTTTRGRRIRTCVLALPVAAVLAAGSACAGISSAQNNSGAGADARNAAAMAGPRSDQWDDLHKAATTESPAAYQGPTQSVTAPKNVKVAVITCLSILSGCVSPATGAQQAAKHLGWQVRVFDGGGTPDKQNAQMLNALSWGAKIILNIAIDPNAVQDGLRAAKRAGVPVGAGSNGLDSPNPPVKPTGNNLGYAFDVGPDYAALGKKAAQWVQADSKGKANIVVYSDKEFPSVLALQKGLLDQLKKCKDCTVQPLRYFTGNQVAQVLPQSVVSYLRSHTDVDYVFIPYDPAAAAVVPAIAQAGLGNRVRLISVLGSQENLNFVRKGQVQVADAAYDNRYMGYAMLDQTSRLLTQKPLADPHGENLPFVVLDKDNVPEAGSDWHASFDYPKTFDGLWK
ncbi:sugar ABC transporter substrate-binding protein [Streptomyces afghaniensis]|uniref:sugar ABC transporter substrate-binding protein n=1 Tax=Streptomyces afghaniensis TaxID=66865 RepID=UPI0027812473|nr:sugar ABC transporter substrate-binding protein [Streptomyces afghaniensis]MDQ1013669.1 ribose transport system substrate-binding protein [Streptomyces afghaniensis]